MSDKTVNVVILSFTPMHYWGFVNDKGHWFGVGFLYKTINNEYHRFHIRKQYYNLSLSLTATKLTLTKQLPCVDFTRPHETLTVLSRGYSASAQAS